MALREWAVTCDALARGEQILLLREDVRRLTSRHGPPEASDESASGARPPGPSLRYGGFWLVPAWDQHDAREVADPYRDRIQALEGLRRDDGKARLQFYASVEYCERITEAPRLLALDGQHTLNSAAVERRVRSAADEAGILLLLLRVFRRERAAVIPAAKLGARHDDSQSWIRLQGTGAADELTSSAGDGTLEPVMGDDRFLRRKAKLLQLSRSIHAV